MRAFSILAPLLTITVLAAQRPPDNGPRQIDPGWHALVGATVIPEAGRRITDATVVIKDGQIVSLVPGGSAPAGARIWDCSGLSIYPGLIDAHVPVEAPAPEANINGNHWNAKVMPQRSALDGAGIPAADAKKLRELGFTSAVLVPRGGIFSGKGAVVLLDEPRTGEQRRVLAKDVFQEINFNGGRGFGGGYPSSQMGVIALIRQTFSDANWRAARKAQLMNSSGMEMPMPAQDSLDSLLLPTPLLFNTSDELEILRAAKIAKEFSRSAMLVGNGFEFRRIQPIAALGMPIILPVSFPSPPAVDTILQREAVSLSSLMAWEQSPSNPQRLIDSGVAIALTTDKLSDRGKFFANVRKAIEHGLSEDEALKALTETPASLVNLSGLVGKIAPGYMANLILVEGNLFDKSATIRESWIQGRRHVINAADHLDLIGSWETEMDLAGISIDNLEFSSNKSLKVHSGEKNVAAKKLKLGRNRLDFLIDAEKLGGKGVVTVNAVVEGKRMFGTGIAPDGSLVNWQGMHSANASEASATSSSPKPEIRTLGKELALPFGAYGRMALPAQETLVIRGATIWTSGPDGKIEDGTLIIQDGKVSYVGNAQGAPVPIGARSIDASGKHISPGLIDAHSHTGISKGINEGSQAVTSEVRIADVINPDDIGWYRQLAGGLTAANQLHGSANPIGGQNSVVKLRWGVSNPDDMRIAGAPEGIKFALGENVKRSRSPTSTRYPKSRMGVEALIRDRFQAAKDYQRAWEKYDRLSAGDQRAALPPQRDLELDALVEILEGERLVHSHSYRQDEILMLCRVAEEFGFKIGTFQHVLEGFKVAESIKTAAIGASTFSDWWAYKMEANDAIPENGAIMFEVGIPVTFNSDSAELARRMNTEAAKAVKYGGVPETEALKFVTLNAAIQLGVADRIGSLEPGKDADFAIWNGSPLSTFSRCLETYVDGRRYFSSEEDQEMRQLAKRERERLIQTVLGLDSKERGDGRGNRESTANNRPGDCGCETEWSIR